MGTTLVAPPVPEVTSGAPNGLPPGALLRPLQPVAGMPPGAFLRQIGPRLAGPAIAQERPAAQPASSTKPFFDWLNTPITSGQSSDHLTPVAQRFADKWQAFKTAHPTVAAVIDPVSAEADWEKLHPNVAGAHEGLNEWGHSMETPKNLAMLVAMPAWRPLSAFFAAQSAHGAYQSAEAAFEAYREGRNPQAAKYATEAGLNALAGLSAAGHASGIQGAHTTEAPETSQDPETSQAGEKSTANVAKTDKVSEGVNSNGVPRGTTVEHPPIGETEPETGRPVLQQSPRPEVNQAAATAEHPAVKDALTDLVKPIEGAEMAGARDEKNPDRIDEKMEQEGQSPRTLRDYSGFRISVDSPEARDKVVQEIKNKFEVPDEQDEFESGHPDNAFHKHTLQVREPGSPVTHEVQILPREVADTVEDRHELYERAREGDQSAMAELKAANEADYQKFVQRTTNEKGAANELESSQAAEPTKKASQESEPKFKFGSTQANIPEDSEAAQALKTAREKIAPEDRAADVNGTEGGIETQPHVTVRYGIRGEATPQMRRFIESQAPFEAKLGKTDTFPPSEHSDGAATIISPIDAPELHRISAEIEKHGDFEPSSFPEYKPHATLGYVKPEAAAKYVGMGETEGKKFPVRSIAISDRNGNLEEIPLKGAPDAVREQGAGSVLQHPPQEDGGPGSERGRVEPGVEGQGPAGARKEEAAPPAGEVGPLRPPRPPDRNAKIDRWAKGERFLTRDPKTGNYRSGEVTFFNEGNQPQAKAGGRSRLSDGTRLDEIPRDAVRIRLSQKPIEPIANTELERRIIERGKASLPETVGKYLEKFTEAGVPTVATDAAKELIPEFKANPTGTDRETAAMGKAIRDSALATVLGAPVDPAKPDVLITTASPGSGKTFTQSGGNPERIGAKIEAISDDYKSFSEMLQQVVDSGRKPVVQWIYVDEPAKTVRRMFMRAIGHGERPGIGRTVQLKYMADAYTQVPRMLERIREEFGDKVQIHAIDNSGPLGTAKVTSDIDPLIESIKSKPYNQVVEEMADETRRLQSEGHFDSDRGKAILKAAEASDPTRSDEARGGSGKVSEGGGPGRGEGQRPQVAGFVLDTQSKSAVNATGGRRTPAGSASFERFKAAERDRRARASS